jgi:molecular chaperone HscB
MIQQRTRIILLPLSLSTTTTTLTKRYQNPMLFNNYHNFLTRTTTFYSPQRILINQRTLSNTTPNHHHDHHHQQQSKQQQQPNPIKLSKCESCGGIVKCCAPICPHCNKILSPASPTHATCGECSYFDMLGLDSSSYQIDASELEKKYKDILKQVHPDKHAQASPEEKRKVAEQAVTINQAFSILKSPLKRALYMLQRKGISAGKEDSKTETDFAILTEAMNLREELESTEKSALAPLRKRLTNNIEELQRELASAIGDANQIDSAVKAAVRMRYLEKVLEELDEKASSG